MFAPDTGAEAPAWEEQVPMMLFAEAGFEPTASGVLGPSVRTLHCPAMFSPSYGG